MSTPSAEIIVRLLAPARMRMPRRVRVTSTHRSTATATPIRMMTARYVGYGRPGRMRKWPLRNRGTLVKSAARPQMIATSSLQKRIRPYCSPLSVCSRTRERVIDTRAPGQTKGARPGRAPRSSPRLVPLPLHRALAGVRILVVLEDGLLDLHHELAARILHGLQEVEV